ncbi:hypothetical protein HK15_02095 [Acetobacter orientalis]|uniref:Uncharacterized protein n=1 Tax=Acetobacter orientalis TaxID=146474 RepID=A0A252AZL8_9PROT|nr:hypothetical protein HK15_02095 [Acetobacter orientalis]
MHFKIQQRITRRFQTIGVIQPIRIPPRNFRISAQPFQRAIWLIIEKAGIEEIGNDPRDIMPFTTKAA